MIKKSELATILLEFVKANDERIMAYGNKDRLNVAIARLEVVEREAVKALNELGYDC